MYFFLLGYYFLRQYIPKLRKKYSRMLLYYWLMIWGGEILDSWEANTTKHQTLINLLQKVWSLPKRMLQVQFVRQHGHLL